MLRTITVVLILTAACSHPTSKPREQKSKPHPVAESRALMYERCNHVERERVRARVNACIAGSGGHQSYSWPCMGEMRSEFVRDICRSDEVN